MPRGNDADAAGKELSAKLGTEPNAEQMIQASAERWPADLRAAQRKPIDGEATAALDASSIEKKIEGDLLDFAVRGEHVIAVIETAAGDVHKELIDLADLLKGGKSAVADHAAEKKADSAKAASDRPADDGSDDDKAAAAKAASDKPAK